MKVCHINEHLALKGGVETYMLSLIPMLEDRGVETCVVYGSGNHDLHPQATCMPNIGRPVFSKDSDAEAELSAFLKDERPDVVHLHNVQNTGALEACLSYGRTLMTSHDFRTVCPANMFFYERTQEVCGRDGAGLGCFLTTVSKHCLTPRPTYAAYFYNRSRIATRKSSSFAGVIAPSGVAKERLVRAGFDEDLVDVLPYFCPLKPRETPRKLPERITISFMGRMAPNKGQEYFIEALGLLPDRVHGLFVGNTFGENSDQLRRLANEAGCEDRLTLRPWATREEIASVFADTTVFIFPSLWQETLGIVGLEALSQGVPVVASALGGVFEWLEDGRNGILVPPKSASDIRDAVLLIVADDERIRSYGRRGIETIRSRFLPSTHLDQLLGCYTRIAGGS